MIIPKEITVGDTTYEIMCTKPRVESPLGTCDYVSGLITVADAAFMHTPRKYELVELAPEEQYDTFWHELTHAILYDMGNQLHRDERFVTAFSRRLSEAILSAKL